MRAHASGREVRPRLRFGGYPATAQRLLRNLGFCVYTAAMADARTRRGGTRPGHKVLNNNVVVTGSKGFTAIGRPVCYGK